MSIYFGSQKIANVSGNSSSGSGSHIDLTTLIDDTTPLPVKVYSSKKTEERLEEVENKLQSSADGTAKMWQKTILNAENGTVKYYETDADNAIDKIMIQCYKFVPGETGIVQTLKEFNNGDADNFYHSEYVQFEDGMKIKDCYRYQTMVNADGCYETELLDPNSFAEIYKFK